MPAAVWVPAAAGLAGGLIQHHAGNRAASQQSKMTNAAARVERDQQKAAEARYEREYAAWEARQRQRNDILSAVLGKYGINLPAGAPAAAAAGAPQRMNLGSLMPESPGPAMAPAATTPGPAMAPAAQPVRFGNTQYGAVAPPPRPGGSLSDFMY